MAISTRAVALLNHQDKPFVGVSAAVVSGLAGGFAGPMWGGLHAPAFAIAGWRFLFGFLIFVAILGARRRLKLWNASELRWILLGGVFFIATVSSLAAAAQRTTVITYMILGAAAPALTALGEHVLFGRRLSQHAHIWIAVACAGAGLAVVGVKAGSATGTGNLFAIAELSTSIGYVLITSRAVKHVPIDRYLLGINGLCLIALAPFMFVTGTHVFTWEELAVIAGIALLGGTISWSMFLLAQRYISTGVTVAIGLIGIPTSGVLAWFLYEQLPSAAQILSAIIVIPAVARLVVITARGGSETIDRAIEDIPEPAL